MNRSARRSRPGTAPAARPPAAGAPAGTPRQAAAPGRAAPPGAPRPRASPPAGRRARRAGPRPGTRRRLGHRTACEGGSRRDTISARLQTPSSTSSRVMGRGRSGDGLREAQLSELQPAVGSRAAEDPVRAVRVQCDRDPGARRVRASDRVVDGCGEHEPAPTGLERPVVLLDALGLVTEVVCELGGLAAEAEDVERDRQRSPVFEHDATVQSFTS